MKKFLPLLFIVFVMSPVLKAQVPYLQVNSQQVNPQKHFPMEANSSSPTDAVIGATDTLEYFFNKHYYRNSTTANANTQFFSLTQPYPGTVSITHCGSIFLNTTTITVNGVEGIVFKNTSSPSSTVPIMFYLCNVNTSNLPVFPPLDSVLTGVTTSSVGNWIGGNFANPITITGKFAVLFREVSTNPLDTVRLFINNAATPTSTVPSAQRYGESLGLMRYNGIFYSTNGIFGAGTDYEFIVAPRVSFNFTAGINVQTNTICTNAYGSFASTTNPTSLLDNRQFNFNKFKAKWPPFNNLIPPTDSIYNWTFSGSSTGTINTTNASAFFNTSGVQTASLAVKYRKSASNAAFLTSVEDVATATLNVSSTAAPTLAISGAGTICSGSTATLTASGNVTYTWTNPATNFTTITVSPTTSTTYTVLGVNGACVGSQTAQIVVVTPPVLAVSGATSACAGAVFSLSASGASTYSWSNSSTSSSISVSSTVAGVQSFTVFGINAPCTPVSAVRNVIINALPNVIYTSADDTLCTKASGGSTIALTGTPPGGNYSGTNSSNGVFTPNTAGKFVSSYSYTDAATGCAKSATLSIVVNNCTGVNENEDNTNWTVFPNPTLNGQITVSSFDSSYQLEVYSLLGIRVMHIQNASGSVKVDLSQQAPGYYFLKLTGSSGQDRVIKIVNQH